MSIAEGRAALPALAATVLGALAAPVSASPFEDPTQGGAVFTGPTQAEPSAIHVNPAALGLFAPGWHFYLIGTGRLDQIGIDRKVVDIDTGATSDGEQLDDVTHSLGWAAAISYNLQRVFFSLGVDLRAPEVYTGDEALGYHSLGGEWERRSLLTTALSWRILSRVWVGIGFTFSKQNLSLRFLRDSALEAGRDSTRGTTSDCDGAPCGAENPAAAETYAIDVDTPWISFPDGLSISAGLVVDVQGWYVGLSYDGPPSVSGSTQAEGSVTMTEAPRDGGEAHTGFALVEYYLPQRLRLGTRGPIKPGLDLVASTRWTNASRHGVYDVRMFGDDLPDDAPIWYPRYRGFDDAYMLELGVEQRDGGERLRGGLRGSIETGAIDGGEATPLQLEGAHVGLAVGGQLRLSPRLTIQLGYQAAWYPTMSADPGVFDPIGRLDCVDAAYDIDACTAVREGRGLPSAAGDYSRFSHAARLQIRLESL